MAKNDIVKLDKIKIKDNLTEELKKLGFDLIPQDRMKKFEGTEQTAYDIWKDTDGQIYVTVELCCEIPIQCCEKIDAETSSA